MRDHPLSDLHVLPEPAIEALRRHWIETAEQLLAVAVTAEGRAGLARLIQIDGPALDAVLARLAEALGPDRPSELGQPAPGGKLGLILPEAHQDESTRHE